MWKVYQISLILYYILCYDQNVTFLAYCLMSYYLYTNFELNLIIYKAIVKCRLKLFWLNNFRVLNRNRLRDKIRSASLRRSHFDNYVDFHFKSFWIWNEKYIILLFYSSYFFNQIIKSFRETTYVCTCNKNSFEISVTFLWIFHLVSVTRVLARKWGLKALFSSKKAIRIQSTLLVRRPGIIL